MPKGVYERKPKDQLMQETAPKTEVALITWLGEDDLHEEGNGPKTNVWNDIVFRKGEPVEIDQPKMIAKAKTNPFYTVET